MTNSATKIEQKWLKLWKLVKNGRESLILSIIESDIGVIESHDKLDVTV